MSFVPHTLEVEGFLTFKERATLDFRRADIWAITGKNGVGKSSLLNGITFALFGMVYGKKKGLDEIIHDRADKARVAITFALDDRRYRVTRIAIRRPSGILSEGLVEYHDGTEWRPVPHTRKIGEMEDWITRRLRIRAESFTAAAALMQNEQMKFFEATPAEMRRMLIELAGLDFYRGLERHIRDMANETGGRAKALTDMLADLPIINDELVASAMQEVIDAEAALNDANARREAAVLTLARAQRRAELTTEQAGLREKAEGAAALAEKEVELRAGVEVAQRAKDQLLVVTGVVRGRKSLADTIAEIGRLEPRREQLLARFRELQAEVTELQKAEEEAGARHRIQISEAEKAEGAARDTETRLRQAEERARIAADIDRIKNEIAAIDAALTDWDTVSAQVVHRDALTRLAASISSLETALTERDLARVELNREQDATNAVAQKVAEAETQYQEIEQGVARAREAEQIAEQARSRALESYQREKAVLEARRSASGSDACFACGEPISGHKAETLAAEIRDLENRLAEIKRAGSDHAQKLEAAKRDRQDLEKKLGEALGRREALRREKEACERRAASLEERAKARHGAAADAWRNALAQARAIGIDLAEPTKADAKDRLRVQVEERQNILSALLPRYQEMTEKRSVRSRLGRDIERLQDQLARAADPGVSLEAAREASEKAREVVTQMRAERDRLGEEAARLRAALEEKRRQMAEVESEGREVKARLEALAHRKTETEQTIESMWADAIDAGWPQEKEPTQDDVDELKSASALLGDLKRQLTLAEEARRTIESTRERVRLVEQELLSLADAPSLEDARREDAATRAAIETAQARVREATTKRDQLVAQSEQRKAIQKELETVDLDAARVKTLVKPLGKSGLQARLMHRALAGIIDAANDVLSRISDGMLALELHIGEEDDDFEIKMRHARAPDRPKSFTFISGGEKFRVAVAMAIGIGQFLAARSGTHRVEMLVIDEGFGSLDEEGLDAMLEELERISIDVGTVVVVSHNRRVHDAIENRYHVSHDGETARVERQIGLAQAAA